MVDTWSIHTTPTARRVTGTGWNKQYITVTCTAQSACWLEGWLEPDEQTRRLKNKNPTVTCSKNKHVTWQGACLQAACEDVRRVLYGDVKSPDSS